MTESFRLSKPPRSDEPFVEQVGACLFELLRTRGLDLTKLEKTHPGVQVIVACSGGPDSVALLAALKAFAQTSGALKLRACHVNHKLRGASSEDDERFCEALCRHWQIPLHIERLSGDIRDEAGLRDARYAVLLAHAQDVNAQFIATGHTKNDQAETFLFRLFRGTGPAGLVGIPPVRALSDQVELVRPMLSLERTAVLDFLERNGIDCRFDQSNDLIDYGRNYIRNRVIPQITQRFPSFGRSIERLRALLHDDESLLTQLAHEAYVQVVEDQDSFDRNKFLQQPASLQRRLLASALRARAIEVSFERIDAIRNLAKRDNGRMQLDELWSVESSAEQLRWCFAADEDRDIADPACEAELAPSGLIVVGRLGIAVQADYWPSERNVEAFPVAQADEALVDLSSAVQPLVVRVRRAGDTIQPFGMSQQVKLKKYLHTHKTDALINPRRQIVVADQQEVLWVPGTGISEKVRVTTRPSHRLRFMHLAGDEAVPS